MLYQIRDGTVSAGDRQILSHIDFEIRGKEHIGIVGRNGAGKTTLLRLIAGELSLDRDDRRKGPGITTSRSVRISLLHQTEEADQEEKLSGGEKTRASIEELLVTGADILLLDEPTNHLDFHALEWLEESIRAYDGAVVLVSHDRYFLDRTVDVIYELRDGRLRRYPGDYTHYRMQRQKELEAEKKAWRRQEQEIARLTELIERFKNKPRKAAFARSRKTLLDRMEKLPKPREDEVHIFTGDITPRVPANKWVLEAKELSPGYEKKLLTLSLRVRSGQKIGIIGDNGAGKTTLLKTIAGLMQPLSGSCRLGDRTLLGYFDQESAALSSDQSVAEHFHALFPALTDKEVRQTLGHYLFRGKAASVRVSELSGGEKARLVLCELLESRPNLLLLDEPTNHMDIQAKETLESAFQAYRGTILFVSHDRYFIRQVADAILVLDGDSAMYYPFGYDHYLERAGKGSKESLTALIRAEDQALLEGIRTVPEKEKGMLKTLSTREAYYDWKLSLLRESMEEARLQAEKVLQRLQAAEEEALISWISGESPGGGTEELHQSLEEAEERWTTSCLEWEEVYTEQGSDSI